MRSPGHPSSGSFPSPAHRPWLGPAALAVVAFLLSPPAMRAEVQGYSKPTVISESGLINSTPVISDTGLIAWHALSREALASEGGGTRIYAYNQGQRQVVTAQNGWPNDAHGRPVIDGNTILWNCVRLPEQQSAEAKVDVVLREVPDEIRDATFPELPGFFAAAEKRDGDPNPGSSINLDPKRQAYLGPYSNVYDWAAAYFGEAGGTNDMKRIVEQILSTNRTDAIPDARLYAESYFDVSPKARRKSVEFGEILRWTPEKKLEWLTQDFRADISPALDGSVAAWQRAKAFPFGWEIMVNDGTRHYQLTTNFYYDLGPVVHADTVAWYGWDGNDYEIYRWDLATKRVSQVTTNDWDDISPALGDGILVWESYATVEADIWASRGGKIFKLSDSLEDDLNPVIDGGRVVWQSFDGDDFEIWMFDPEQGDADPATGLKTGKSIQITSNEYDDVHPDLRDGVLTWMGYVDNWDAEIFVMNLDTSEKKQITDNDYEDRDPQTAKKMIVWHAETGKTSDIMLASPDE